MRKLTLVFTVPAVVGLMALASPALAQTTVTSFDTFTNTPTAGVWFESDVRTGGTASINDLTGLGGDLETNQPLPIGAAKLTTDLTNAAKAEVAVVNGYGMPDNIFSALSIMYTYHKAANASQSLAAAPSLHSGRIGGSKSHEKPTGRRRGHRRGVSQSRHQIRHLFAGLRMVAGMGGADPPEAREEFRPAISPMLA